MLHKKVERYKCVLTKLHLNSNLIFYKISLIITVDWLILTICHQKFLLLLSCHQNAFLHQLPVKRYVIVVSAF